MTERKLLIKIAYYYYRLGLTQNEIAQRLGMSRQRTNRLLKRCRDEGIVEIRIAGFAESHIELEGELEAKFGLKQVVVTQEAEGGQLFDVLGAAAAEYMGQSVAGQKTIGISWGRTMYSMVRYLPQATGVSEDLRVVQLVGNMSELSRDVQPDEVTRLFASKLGAKPVLLYAPVYMKNKVAKYTLLHEDSIKSVFDLMPQCESVFLSVSGMESDYTWLNQKVIEEEFLSELRRKNAVGNICLRYFNEEGDCIDAELHHMEIGIDAGTLRKIPNVVCAAGGPEKYRAIHSAIKGKYIDTLITDKATAEYLIQQQS